MPRSLKIWTEASERASEMRTLGMACDPNCDEREACSVTCPACGESVVKPSEARLSRVRGKSATDREGPSPASRLSPLGTLSPQAGKGKKGHAAFGSASLVLAKAQSSH